jgi:hypothetical protein
MEVIKIGGSIDKELDIFWLQGAVRLSLLNIDDCDYDKTIHFNMEDYVYCSHVKGKFKVIILDGILYLQSEDGSKILEYKSSTWNLSRDDVFKFEDCLCIEYNGDIYPIIRNGSNTYTHLSGNEWVGFCDSSIIKVGTELSYKGGDYLHEIEVIDHDKQEILIGGVPFRITRELFQKYKIPSVVDTPHFKEFIEVLNSQFKRDGEVKITNSSADSVTLLIPSVKVEVINGEDRLFNGDIPYSEIASKILDVKTVRTNPFEIRISNNLHIDCNIVETRNCVRNWHVYHRCLGDADGQVTIPKIKDSPIMVALIISSFARTFNLDDDSIYDGGTLFYRFGIIDDEDMAIFLQDNFNYEIEEEEDCDEEW